MRVVCILAALCACGDNTRGIELVPVAALPSGTRAVAFDRDNATVVRTADGAVKRLVGKSWRAVDLGARRAIDFGSDNDGTLLMMSSQPRTLHQLAGGVLVDVGGVVLASYVHMPMQVPSGNRYVREIDGGQRSFVLSPGTTTWAETPPMFFSRPVRAHDGTLYAATAAGVQRFEADGSRTLVAACETFGAPRCTSLLVGADGQQLVVADPHANEVILVDDDVDRIALPEANVPVQLAVGAGVTVVLAKLEARDPNDEAYFLYALRGSGIELVVGDDPPSAATQLAVDHAGTVHVATKQLSKVSLP